MKIIHISDLHLGRTLNQISLIDDQREMLMNQILPVIKEKNPDVLLIAGDIYDNYSPTHEAMKLLDDFMLNVNQLGVKILIIGGNHDSGIRVDHHHELLKTSGCYLYGSYQGRVEKVTLEDEYGKVNFYLLPYITNDIYRQYHKDADNSLSYDEAVHRIIDSLHINKEERNVILSHQYVSGSERSSSDIKPLVGSESETDRINVTWYQDFDYIALGHIHKHYSLLDGRAVYPGSLLPYAYDEDSRRCLSYVELGKKGEFHRENIELKVPHEIKIYTGTMDDILAMNDDKNHYVFVIFTDDKISPTLGSDLRQKFPLFLGSKRICESSESPEFDSVSLQEKKDPIMTIREFFTIANNGEPTEEEWKLITEIYQECEKDNLEQKQGGTDNETIESGNAGL